MPSQVPASGTPRPQVRVQIGHEVIGTIAALAASQVEGVVGLSPGLVGNLSERLGKRSQGPHGVRVDLEGQTVGLSLNLVVAYGSRIPEVAQRVQERVKRMVEAMTGLWVREVSIHVQGVSFTPARSGRGPS
ncbi:MAG: Asp23/Gls24 family envelope stress response protein [Firmicutes bacterium]|nr:Asp23/Gls24 family envelope stress response protein [Alicyclobacillaceae bacterium]MCL6496674.1 Asp23/Gls24 family envelope stress response protein [Bacillota bacterium]